MDCELALTWRTPSGMLEGLLRGEYFRKRKRTSIRASVGIISRLTLQTLNKD